MRAFKQYAWLLLIAVFLSGCVGLTKAPETNVERLALLKVSYGEVIATATLYAEEGRLSAGQVNKIDESFDDIEKGFRLAETAITLASDLDFNNNASAINSSLQILRDILTEVE